MRHSSNGASYVVRLALAIILGGFLAVIALTMFFFAFAKEAQAQAPAASTWFVASGDPKNNSVYHRFYTEWPKACLSIVKLETSPTSGGVENVQMLASKAHLAFVPSDLLYYYRTVTPTIVENIYSLIPLYEEEAHVIGRGVIKGGLFKSDTTITEVKDMNNRSVGATGGSWYSASVYFASLGLKTNVVNYPSMVELKKALLEGKIDGMFVMAGAPTSAVSDLGSEYRLLKLGKDFQTKLVATKLYSTAVITYPGLGTVDTVSAQAVLATRQWKSPRMNAQLKEFRDCFYRELAEHQDVTGLHPKWQKLPEQPGAARWQPYVFK